MVISLFFGKNELDVFSIDRVTGTLVPVPGGQYPMKAGLGLISITPDKKYLLASGGNDIFTFAIDHASGKLSRVSELPGGSDCCSLDRAFLPGTSFFFQVGSSGIRTFRLSASGKVTIVRTLENFTYNRLAIDPRGHFLFVSGPVNEVHVFRIGAGASLTKVGSFEAAPQFNTVFSLAIDKSGRFLYAFSADKVGELAIDSGTGKLTPLAGSPFVYEYHDVAA